MHSWLRGKNALKAKARMSKNLRPHHNSLFTAFSFAWEGIVATFKRERNFKIELVIAALALIVSAVLQLEPLEWVLIIILIALVLALELANSALESLVDLASPEQHPLAKQAKDAMAGAVLVSALLAAVCGLIIFINAFDASKFMGQ